MLSKVLRVKALEGAGRDKRPNVLAVKSTAKVPGVKR
jgi:hypothetical protein